MNILALIPARMGSSRYPGKPMARLLGKPMIGHVYERVRRNHHLMLTAVATCDQEIADYITSIGGRVVMTGHHHARASDRCAEALQILEREENCVFDIVVMAQGDEPMLHPTMITEAIAPMLRDVAVVVTNLLGRITAEPEFQDRNCIKVVCDLKGDALYFSRQPIPTRSSTDEIPTGKQVCVIPFRREFLLEYIRMTPTPLEIAESVDMMRILEHGSKVRMAPTGYLTYAVDTKEDAERVEKLLRLDPLTATYLDEI